MGLRVSAAIVTDELSSGILTTTCHNFSKNLTFMRSNHCNGITSLDHLPGLFVTVQGLHSP